MKIIISAGNRKREIIGPYSVCLSKEDLLILLRSIPNPDNFSYGWIEITEKSPPLVNTPPSSWED